MPVIKRLKFMAKRGSTESWILLLHIRRCHVVSSHAVHFYSKSPEITLKKCCQMVSAARQDDMVWSNCKWDIFTSIIMQLKLQFQGPVRNIRNQFEEAA